MHKLATKVAPNDVTVDKKDAFMGFYGLIDEAKSVERKQGAKRKVRDRHSQSMWWLKLLYNNL